jgi:hypothetical protein
VRRTDRAAPALRPEIDTIATIPVRELGHMHMDPPEPVPGAGDGMLLKELSAGAIDDFVDSAAGEAGSALISAEIRHLGGALGRPAPEHGALAAIEWPFLMITTRRRRSARVIGAIDRESAGIRRPGRQTR